MDKREIPADPFGPAALTFTKELVLQREVDVEVESCDKGGNFIGWMFVDDKNLAISLVEVRHSNNLYFSGSQFRCTYNSQ